MSDAPAVSVVMPLYNVQRLLPSALDSVLAQSFADFEIIAVDDGSRDATLQILRQYQARDARVKIITRPNTGIVGALNDGLAAAKAPLIARMDGDDLCLPERFARQVAYLREHPRCVLVGSQVLLIDGDGDPICPHHLTRFTHADIDHAHLHRGWPVIHPAVMMRAEAVQKVGGYREQYKWLEDTDLFLRLAEVGELANLPEVLLKYRLHFESVCHTRFDVQGPLKAKLYEETLRRRGLASRPDAPPVVADRPRSEVHRLWAWWALAAGNVATARKHASRALRQSPWQAASWRVMACAVRGH